MSAATAQEKLTKMAKMLPAMNARVYENLDWAYLWLTCAEVEDSAMFNPSRPDAANGQAIGFLLDDLQKRFNYVHTEHEHGNHTLWIGQDKDMKWYVARSRTGTILDCYAAIFDSQEVPNAS